MIMKRIFLLFLVLEFFPETSWANFSAGKGDALKGSMGSAGKGALDSSSGTVKGKIKASRRKSDASEQESRKSMGLGLVGGSTATYGNGLIFNFDPWSFIRTQIGVGYNSTGAKTGAAVGVVLDLTSRFGIDSGVALVHSFGTKDKVSVDAKFMPENGGSAEKVEAIRKFRLSPSNYYSVFFGPFFEITNVICIEGHVNYNKVISGNDVEFYDTLSYNQPIEPTNEEKIYADFEQKAKNKLNINGWGFSLGVQFRI